MFQMRDENEVGPYPPSISGSVAPVRVDILKRRTRIEKELAKIGAMHVQ